MKAKHIGPITDMFTEFHRVGDYCLTKHSTLLGAVELDGVDPDGLTENDFMALAAISRTIYNSLPETVKSITQYYIHMDNARIKFKDRDRPKSHYLSKRRERFLEGKRLSATRIVHFFEIKPNENLTKLSPADFLKHLVLAARKETSRDVLKRYLSSQQQVVIYEKELRRQKEEVDEILSEVQARWDTVSGCKLLKAPQLWSYLKFLANMEPAELYDGLDDKIPDEQWDAKLANGDIEPVRVDNIDMLKFYGIENSYARILSVTRFEQEDEYIEPGLWSCKKYSPARLPGNYVVMCRYLPLSRRQQKKMFKEKKDALQRKNLSVVDILRGEMENLTRKEKRQQMKPAIREKLEAIEEAEGLEERWGTAQSAVAVLGKSVRNVNRTIKALTKSLRISGISTVVETIDLPHCYRSILPGGAGHSLRNINVNSSQFGALTLINRPHEGQITVEDLKGEEAQYILFSADGTPFHYSPYVGGLSITIGIGPSRSGKTFLKNSIASHFLKYGGVYRAIDIDPGTEPLAQFFGEDGSIFRMDDDASKGFNFFQSARGPYDTLFFEHARAMIMQMIRSNDDESLQKLAEGDQEEIDFAIKEALGLPEHLRCLSAMHGLCSSSVKRKLARWCGQGHFAPLFDQLKDAIGSIDKQVAVFNLAGIKNNTHLLPLAMSEIFFRVTRMFEDKNQIDVPKFLEVDEAHALLKFKYMCDYLIQSARTWGKWQGGIGLWSQAAKEFVKIEDWDVFRAQVTTFIFTADPALDTAQYRKIFDLTEGECEAIKKLRPKREAYIIQRDLGISKSFIIDVEPEQYVVNTSKPSERVLREKLIKQFGFEQGLQETIKALNLNQQERAA